MLFSSSYDRITDLYNVKVKGREKKLTASSSEKITAKWINWSGQLQGNETRG